MAMEDATQSIWDETEKPLMEDTPVPEGETPIKAGTLNQLILVLTSEENLGISKNQLIRDQLNF